MAFEAFLTQDKVRPKKGRRLTVTLSLALHGALLVGAAVYSFWHVDVLSPPTVTVTFLTSSPPPPPPPPAAKKKSTPKVKPVTPKEIVQPKPNEILQPRRQRQEEKEDEGVEGGVEGGVAGGVVGAPKPPPPKQVEAPKPVANNIGKSLLLTDPEKDPQYRVVMPSALGSSGMIRFALLRICVSKDGNVSEVKILKGMDPSIDPLLRQKIMTWRYKPYDVEGHPVPFCYGLRYESRTQ